MKRLIYSALPLGLLLLAAALVTTSCSKDDPAPTPSPEPVPAVDLLETISEGYWEDSFVLLYDGHPDAQGNPTSVSIFDYPMAFISDPIRFMIGAFYICPDQTIRQFRGPYYAANGDLVPIYHIDSTYQILITPDRTALELRAIKHDTRRNYLHGLRLQPTKITEESIIFEQTIREEYQAEFLEEFPEVTRVRIGWYRIDNPDELRTCPPDWAIGLDPEGHITIHPY